MLAAIRRALSLNGRVLVIDFIRDAAVHKSHPFPWIIEHVYVQRLIIFSFLFLLVININSRIRAVLNDHNIFDLGVRMKVSFGGRS